jgi:hypothetical protein
MARNSLVSCVSTPAARQADRLLGFAAPFRLRTWAVEAAGGLAAITQVAHDTPGRAYYDRKLADGKSRKEALRAVKSLPDPPRPYDQHHTRCFNVPKNQPLTTKRLRSGQALPGRTGLQPEQTYAQRWWSRLAAVVSSR